MLIYFKIYFLATLQNRNYIKYYVVSQQTALYNSTNNNFWIPMEITFNNPLKDSFL